MTSWQQEKNFSCSICLDLLKDPVTVPCGHSYCMSCIQNYWDKEDERGSHSCPQCRRTFSPRPVLEKNIMLAELVEELKKTELRSGLYYLVGPSGNLHQNVCSLHDEVMKIFCRTDQRCICYLCLMDEHKNHETVSAAAEFTEKQKKLGETRLEVQQRIESREKDMKELQQEVENINTSADKAVEDSEEIFNQMIRLLQKRSSEVTQQIRSQQEAEVSRVLDLQEELEQEIRDLRSKDREMETLSHTEDHSQFLHRYSSLSALSQSTHSSGLPVCPLRFFEEVTKAASDTRDKLQELLTAKLENISMTEAIIDVLPPNQEPKSRNDFLKYSRELTLDPNTANMYLLLSEGNRKAKVMKQQRYHYTHPDRFTACVQVLSREHLTGRCYWEVEWRGEAVYVTVAYGDTPRSDNCLFGCNDRSWSLYCGIDLYRFWCNKVRTPVSGPGSSRVGVYLDHGAGVLAFYSVSETMTLLHRVQTTFTQPLHAGFRFGTVGDSAEFIKLK
uniref:Tripartite motif-containing protein 16-like n=1 Tax=Oryzias melastigma TaxID=30732 RepID=A0A3B3CVP8_ORYME